MISIHILSNDLRIKQKIEIKFTNYRPTMNIILIGNHLQSQITVNLTIIQKNKYINFIVSHGYPLYQDLINIYLEYILKY
jgi:hypothetical protein